MNPPNLSDIYEKRFRGFEEYRIRVWKVLNKQFFSKWIKRNHTVLDLGCGYGEFINNIECNVRFAMDLNPNTKEFLNKDILFHQQDCAKRWNIKKESLDIVFTSNFFEHLPSKTHLESTISNIYHALKPNGLLIAMGPNISILHGKYWDFWDHHVPLSEESLSEILNLNNFEVIKSYHKFLPYNMVRSKQKPMFLLKLYLKFSIFWKLWGKQFLIIAKK